MVTNWLNILIQTTIYLERAITLSALSLLKTDSVIYNIEVV